MSGPANFTATPEKTYKRKSRRPDQSGLKVYQTLQSPQNNRSPLKIH